MSDPFDEDVVAGERPLLIALRVPAIAAMPEFVGRYRCSVTEYMCPSAPDEPPTATGYGSIEFESTGNGKFRSGAMSERVHDDTRRFGERVCTFQLVSGEYHLSSSNSGTATSGNSIPAVTAIAGHISETCLTSALARAPATMRRFLRPLSSFSPRTEAPNGLALARLESRSACVDQRTDYCERRSHFCTRSSFPSRNFASL